MKTFNNYNKAIEAAENFFITNFGYTNGVGVESANGSKVEFYSKDDPGMDDTFTCIVNDGNNYRCKNGGQLEINAFNIY